MSTVDTVRSMLGEEYRQLRDKWSPWPEDHAKRCQAIRERVVLDHRDLANFRLVLAQPNLSPQQRKALEAEVRVINARIASDLRFLSKGE